MYSRANLASIRITRDLQEVESVMDQSNATMNIVFPNGTDDLLLQKVTLVMSQGPYRGGSFNFMIEIPSGYPFVAPKVTCMSRLWHPAVNLLTLEVHLPILGKEWRPVLSLSTILLALHLMMLEPSAEEPANEVAAAAVGTSPSVFVEQVQATLRGGVFFGLQFDPHPMFVVNPAGMDTAGNFAAGGFSRPTLGQVNPFCVAIRPAPMKRKRSGDGSDDELGMSYELDRMCINDQKLQLSCTEGLKRQRTVEDDDAMSQVSQYAAPPLPHQQQQLQFGAIPQQFAPPPAQQQFLWNARATVA